MMLRDSFDLCVVGGGSAGIAAAVTAARAGARTILIEKHAFPGGNATAGGVGTICGLAARGTGERLASPFALEFADDVQKLSKKEPIGFVEGLSFLPYSLPAFTHCSLAFLRQSGVVNIFGSTVCEVEVAEKRITAVTLCHRGENHTINASSIIDCSGDAIISKLAGLPIQPLEPEQAAALSFRISGVPVIGERNLLILILKAIAGAVREKKLPERSKYLNIVPGSLYGNSVSLKLSCFYGGSYTPEQGAKLEMEGRLLTGEIVGLLKKEAADFSDIELEWVASEMGVRSGGRGAGYETLTEDMVLNAKKSDREVAKGLWPVEFWTNSIRPEVRYFSEGDYYSITDGMLTSRYCDNLYFAGRTISGTERALGSARVIGTALSTGEAAARLAIESAGQSRR